MRRSLYLAGIGAVAVLGACVTINVYFPAAAAEKAADRIIEEVWGPDAVKGDVAPAPQSRAPGLLRRVLTAGLELLVPSAAAQQANLDISTPAVTAIKDSMAARHSKLAPFYDSGAIGLTDTGLITVRDAKAIPLKDRPTVNREVAEENRDRNALYSAIAEANGRPEWEPDIRKTFAERWIAKAQRGWWYQSGGSWRQR